MTTMMIMPRPGTGLLLALIPGGKIRAVAFDQRQLGNNPRLKNRSRSHWSSGTSWRVDWLSIRTGVCDGRRIRGMLEEKQLQSSSCGFIWLAKRNVLTRVAAIRGRRHEENDDEAATAASATK